MTQNQLISLKISSRIHNFTSSNHIHLDQHSSCLSVWYFWFTQTSIKTCGSSRLVIFQVHLDFWFIQIGHTSASSRLLSNIWFIYIGQWSYHMITQTSIKNSFNQIYHSSVSPRYMFICHAFGSSRLILRLFIVHLEFYLKICLWLTLTFIQDVYGSSKPLVSMFMVHLDFY